MRRVKVTAITSVSDGNRRYHTGEIAVVDDGTARDWIDGRLAEPVDDDDTTEAPARGRRRGARKTATKRAATKATTPPPVPPSQPSTPAPPPEK